MATAFNTQGAIPQTSLLPGLGGTSVATTPVSKALNSAAAPTTNLGASFFGAPVGSNAGALGAAPKTAQPTLNASAALSSGGLIPVPKTTPSLPASPSAGINWNALTMVPQTSSAPQSQTVTHPDGTQIKTTYPVAVPPSSAPSSVTPPAPPPPALPDYGSQQYSPATPPTFPGLIGAGANASQTAASVGSKEQQDAYAAAQKYGDQLSGLIKQQGVENSNINASPLQIDFKQGQAAGLDSLFAAEEQAASQGLQSESTLANTGVTSQGQGISGLSSAASNAAPSPNAGFFGNPLNTNTSSTSPLPQGAQDFISSLAQQVQNGLMTRADAESRLSAYGPVGLQSLNTALGGSFNTNASNASAATTATGQQLQTAAATANNALDTLASSFGSLSGLQTLGVPLTNSIANWIGTALGQGALSKYKANLADARAQLVGALNTAGGTPTGNEATALQYLPDDMTPAQFSANVGTAQQPGIVRQLLQQKVSQFTASGQQPNASLPGNTNTAGGSIYNW